MPRRRYRHYDDYDYYRRRRGCGYRLKRFFTNVGIILLCLLIGGLLIGLAFLAYTYRAYLPTILRTIISLGALILGFFVVKFIIEMITAMVNAISAMRVRASQAGKAKVELSKRKLERDAYREHLQKSQQPKRVEPTPSQPVTTTLSRDVQEPLVRRLQSENERPKSAVPGMPQRTTVTYREIEQRVKPGQLVALVRGNGSLRVETWKAFKTLLVLGSSSSGKSTTIAEKTLAFASGGGAIIPCDPHDTKEDSLFKKIAPLAHALYPGAIFAVDHADILRNMRLVNAILQDRVGGGDCSIPVLLIVEELNRLLRDKAIAKEIALILEALGEEGRGYNVFIMVGCQRVTGLSEIRKSFISYIVHRCDESEAKLVIPYRYAKYCSELRPGQCFVKDSNSDTEPGLQVLVTRQDVERASGFPGSSRSISERPTARLDPRQAPRLVPGHAIPPRQRPGVPTQRPTGKTPSRPVHRNRLEPVQRKTETPLVRRQHNPLHTWSLEPPTSQKPPDLPRLPDVRKPEITPPSTRERETDELSPSDLSNSQQLEILALMRKKKSNQ